MQNIKIGLFCFCLLLCTSFSVKAAEDVGPIAQKRMSIVLSELTRNYRKTVDEKFFDPKNYQGAAYFAGKYLGNRFTFSKTRYASDAGGGFYVSLEDVKAVIKRLFDRELADITPGTYDFMTFDGKDFLLHPSDGDPAYWAQVKEAKELKTGNIAVKGVFRDPEKFEVATFTAELKPIVWKGMKTYAVISLAYTRKEK